MSESTTGQVTCSSCNKVIKYPVSKAGLSGKCPGCGNRITLPALSKKPPQPAGPNKIVVAELPKPVPASKAPPPQQVIQSRVASVIAAPVELPVPPTPEEAELARFMADGQNASVVAKLLDRVKQICTSSEELMYVAVQQKPVANLSPDAVVLTSKRAIIFRQKLLGQMEFVDVPWAMVANVHVKEGFIGATLSITGSNGHVESVDYLPKEQARKVYRYGQEMEEKMVEWRRSREMEEDRNAADQVVVNTAVATQPAALQQAPEDPLQRLSKLKAMLEAGLIEQSEFEATKAKILSSI